MFMNSLGKSPETKHGGIRSAIWRFILGGILGSVLSGAVLWSSVWGIGYIREGDQLFVAQTPSGYFLLGTIALMYVVPFGFIVSAISAVSGESSCGVLLGILCSMPFVILCPLFAQVFPGLELLEIAAVAVALISCGALVPKLVR